MILVRGLRPCLTWQRQPFPGQPASAGRLGMLAALILRHAVLRSACEVDVVSHS